MKQVLPRFSKPAPTILVNGVRLARHRCTRTRISQLRKIVVDWPGSVTAARVHLLVIGMHGSAKRYTCVRGIPFPFCACAVDGNVPVPSRALLLSAAIGVASFRFRAGNDSLVLVPRGAGNDPEEVRQGLHVT